MRAVLDKFCPSCGALMKRVKRTNNVRYECPSSDCDVIDVRLDGRVRKSCV